MVDRLASINGRFGRLAGDEILIAAARQIAQRLDGASLFRWTGSAFAVITEASTEDQLRQVGALRMGKNIEANNRSAMLMITCSTQVQRLALKMSAELVYRNMDAFLTGHIGESIQL